jgi:hypothetical protein
LEHLPEWNPNSYQLTVEKYRDWAASNERFPSNGNKLNALEFNLCNWCAGQKAQHPDCQVKQGKKSFLPMHKREMFDRIPGFVWKEDEKARKKRKFASKVDFYDDPDLDKDEEEDEEVLLLRNKTIEIGTTRRSSGDVEGEYHCNIMDLNDPQLCSVDLLAEETEDDHEMIETDFELDYPQISAAEYISDNNFVVPLGLINSGGTRLEQAKFRKQCIQRYDKKCIITDKSDYICQACHIKPYAESNDFEKQDVDNSLLMSANFHIRFDHFLFSINPETLRIELSDELLSSEPNLAKYNGKQLNLSNNSRRYLQDHYKKFTNN